MPYLGFVVVPADRAADAVAQVLVMATGALSVSEISGVLTQLGSPRAPTTVAAALRSDRRFRREGSRWAFAEPLRARGHILERIRPLLAEQDSVPLREVQAALAGLWISDDELRQLLLSGPFLLAGDTVRRRPSLAPTVLPPSMCPGVYRTADGWVHPLTFGPHQGSSLAVPVPSALVILAGLDYPSTCRLDEGVSLVWRYPPGTMVFSEAVLRAHRPGQRVLLCFGDDGSFAMTPIPALRRTGEPWADALSLMGFESAGDAGADQVAVRLALGLAPDLPLDVLLASCRRKGEFEIAELLQDRDDSDLPTPEQLLA